MSLITIDQLDMAVPKARYEDLIRYIDFLNEGMEKFEINTPTGSRLSSRSSLTNRRISGAPKRT